MCCVRHSVTPETQRQFSLPLTINCYVWTHMTMLDMDLGEAPHNMKQQFFYVTIHSHT